MLAKPKTQKQPVTVEILRYMVEAGGEDPTLTDLRLLAICLVAFAGLMKCDELLKLTCSDIVFRDQSMTINIRSSKTDQFRDGDSLVIAHTGTLTCPVGMMEWLV